MRSSGFVFGRAECVWLIFGLGNPGPQYEATYHNVGFRVIRQLAEKHEVRLRHQCGPALISDKVVIGAQTAVLVEPQTYVNRSGLALAKPLERFQSTIRNVIVVYDELALPVGKIRIRQRGSAGGHNGIKSLISSGGTDEFVRVRVGIMPEHPVEGVRDFVLSRVSKQDRALLDQAEDVATEAVEALLKDGIERAMATYNGIDLRGKTEEV
jgi:PTH1 family peptidyl-tRNA hydrolase